MARIRLSISFELPPGAPRQAALDYAVDAVATMKGCLRPDGWDGPDSEGDPMFYLDPDSVRGSTVVTRGNHRQILRSQG